MRILIVSPVGTHPQHEGNWERVFQLASCLHELGHTVHLLHLRTKAFASGSPDIEAATEFFSGRLQVVDTLNWHSLVRPGVPLRMALFQRLRSLAALVSWRFWRVLNRHADRFRGLDAWAPANLGTVLREIKHSYAPDAVIVVYAIFSKFLNHFPKSTLKLIDTLDKLADRDREAQAKGESGWISLTRKQEARALLRADRIVAIQQEEARYFENLCEGKRSIFCVEMLANVVKVPPPSQASICIGFIGSANPANVSGVRWFLSEIWPLIQKQVPGSSLLLAGAICPLVEKAPGVVQLGRIDSRDDFYKRCRLVINPVKVGTGLKLKSVEALRFGRPLVCTHHGASGLTFTGSEGFVATDSAEEFAAACIELLQHPVRADELAQLASNYSSSLRQQSVMALQASLAK